MNHTMSTDTNPDLIMCGTCGDEFTQHDRGTCGNCMAGETAALHVEIERLAALEAENAALKRDLQYARDGLTKGRTRMREDNERLRAALEKIEAGNCIDPRTVARDALGPNYAARCFTPSDGWPDTDAERASATTSPNAKVSGAGKPSALIDGLGTGGKKL